MVTAASAFPGGVYPERDEQREGMLERAFTAAQFFTGGIGLGQRRLERIVAATNAAAAGVEALPDDALLARATELRAALRRAALCDLELTARCFALVREAAAPRSRNATSTCSSSVAGRCSTACWPRWRPARARPLPRPLPRPPRHSLAVRYTSSRSTTILPCATPTGCVRCMVKPSGSPWAASGREWRPPRGALPIAATSPTAATRK